jgi:hypothetical protein
MPQPLRYRRCPSCAVIRQASTFRRAPMQGFARGQLERRTCPACGHVAQLMDFPIAERPDDQGEAS